LNKTVKLGASYTIGTYILPGEPTQMLGKILESKIKLAISTCDKIIEGVKRKEFDLGLIESPIFDDELVYKEWMEDELVVCSKASLGKTLDEERLSSCQLLCRAENSPTRMIISDFFQEQGLTYETFDSLMQVDNATSAIQGIKWSRPDKEHPTIAIVSLLAIEEELKRKELYQARIGDKPMVRHFYLIYQQKKADYPHLEEMIEYLKEWKHSLLAEPA
jgi:DNA-binding transcriptional LysR family regulator